ncbi:hypothetical protein OH779_00100 [Actinacidiphila glaucinigra]|uniref:hypothetical protein n=1 Tax=Actinacidiphila glaucinigra TaxID=235986 RepID=UPI00386DE1B8
MGEQGGGCGVGFDGAGEEEPGGLEAAQEGLGVGGSWGCEGVVDVGEGGGDGLLDRGVVVLGE